MSPFELSLRTVTPCFCRGRDASTPELRPPAFKGQLRWWYRAWHPLAVLGPGDGPWAEGRVMGGTESHTGQSPFLLRIVEPEEKREITWQQIERDAPRGSRMQVGGTRYLGFTFRETRDGRERTQHSAIAENVAFTAMHRFPRPKAMSEEAARGLVAAWWLLAHLGGVGARARRGFGSLALEGWSWPGREQLLAELPLPSRAANAGEWQELTLRGLNVLQAWRGSGSWPDGYPHPHLGPGATVVVQSELESQRAMDALEEAGRSLAESRREHRGPRGEVDGRVTVGLPLTTGRRPTTTWQPGSWRTERIDSDIHASPLHLHVGAFKGGVGLVWSRLTGPVPGLGQYRVSKDNSRDTIRQQAPNTLDAIVRSLEGTRWTVGARR